MPEVFLTAAELKGKRPLPRCCVVCGRKKVQMEEAKFAANAGYNWSPMGGTTQTVRYLTVTLPLCQEHKGYFSKWGMLLLFLVLGLFGVFFVLMIVSMIAGFTMGASAGYVIVPVVLLAFVSIIGFGLFAVLGTRSGVSTRGIERRGMRLANVSKEFADTLEDLREEHGPEGDDEEEFEAYSGGGFSRKIPRKAWDTYDDDRPRRRRSRDEDNEDEYDDRPRRRRDRDDY